MEDNNKLDETTVTFEASEEATNSTPVQNVPEPTEQKCECKKEKKCKCNCMCIINCILIIGLILIYILHFTGIGAKGGSNQDSTVSLVNKDAKPPLNETVGELKIAYVNTDTLMAKYQYAIDLKKRVEQATNKQESFARQEEQFQADYQNYLQTGEKLSYAQQQEKERELKERYDKLMQQEKQYANSMMQEQKNLQDESEKMTQTVYDFIRDYNAQNHEYHLILARSFNSSPILYGDVRMDITDEIVKGLNEDYARKKANK